MCVICNIPVETKNRESHNNGKKHKNNLKLFEASQKRRNSAIEVTGYPLNISKDALIGYFSQFGRINFHYFKNNSTFIFYKEPYSTIRALSTQHYFEDILFTVKRHIPEEVSGKIS